MKSNSERRPASQAPDSYSQLDGVNERMAYVNLLRTESCGIGEQMSADGIHELADIILYEAGRAGRITSFDAFVAESYERESNQYPNVIHLTAEIPYGHSPQEKALLMVNFLGCLRTHPPFDKPGSFLLAIMANMIRARGE